MSPKLSPEFLFNKVRDRNTLPYLHRDLLKIGRTKKKIGYQTWMQLNSELSVSVVYYSTDIVTQKFDGTVIVRNGGWFTSTTLMRINHLLKLFTQWRICSQNGTWVWRSHSNPTASLTPSGVIPFQDGDRLVNGDLFVPYSDDRAWYFMDSRIKQVLRGSRTRKDVVESLLETTDEQVLKGSLRKHRRGYDLNPECKLKRKAPTPKSVHTFEPKPRLVLA